MFKFNDRLKNIPKKVEKPTKDYKFTRYNIPNEQEKTVSRIDGFADGLEALMQWIEHVLNTERYRYSIYPDFYGVEFEQYYTQPYVFFEATIEKTLWDALKVNDLIKRIEIIEIRQLTKSSASVTFIVYSSYGNFDKNLSVSI
jgi:hypothetical protein